MAFKLKNPLKTPLKQQQFGPQPAPPIDPNETVIIDDVRNPFIGPFTEDPNVKKELMRSRYTKKNPSNKEDPTFQPVTNIMGTRYPASTKYFWNSKRDEDFKPIEGSKKIISSEYDKDGNPKFLVGGMDTASNAEYRGLNYDLETPEDLYDPINPTGEYNADAFAESVKKAKQNFAQRFENPEFQKRALEQWYFGTGEKVDNRDLESIKNTGLHTDIKKNSSMLDAGRYSSPRYYHNIDQGGGTITVSGNDPSIIEHEMLHASSADELGTPNFNRILGKPVRPIEGPGSDNRDLTDYLRSGVEGHTNFQDFRIRAFDKANLEYGDQIDMPTLKKWMQDKELHSNDSMFYYEPEKLLEAINTMASKEQKTPGTQKWEALSAEQMLTDIEQNKQMYS
tara:strand:- start:352 stop:1536 length:1185 start_codon:yes stop_codon:yes gene_type:complete